MSKKIFIITLLAALSVSGFSYSQETVTWTDCVISAKKNNPELMAAAENVRQARADRDVEIGAVLPQVDGTIGVKRTQSVTRDARSKYRESIATAVDSEIAAEQLLFDGFKTYSEISSAVATVRAERYNYAVTSSNIRLALRNAFAGLLEAQELVLITKEIAKRRAQNLELVRLRYKAGREHKGSLLTAEADFSNAEFEVAQAEREASLAQRRLWKELGTDKLKPMRAKGKFSVREKYDTTPDFEQLADGTPFLKELIAIKETARYDLQSEQADFFPTVYMNGSVDRTNHDWPPKHIGWSGNITLSVPFFDGGSREAEILKTRSALREAKANERGGRNSVLVTLESTWKNLRDSLEYASVRKKFLEATEERAKITSAQYEKGLTSFDDWIIIEDNLADAKKFYLSAQADMLTAEAYWIQAMGGTLEYE